MLRILLNQPNDLFFSLELPIHSFKCKLSDICSAFRFLRVVRYTFIHILREGVSKTSTRAFDDRTTNTASFDANRNELIEWMSYDYQLSARKNKFENRLNEVSLDDDWNAIGYRERVLRETQILARWYTYAVSVSMRNVSTQEMWVQILLNLYIELYNKYSGY